MQCIKVLLWLEPHFTSDIKCRGLQVARETCCFGVGRLDCPEVSCNEPHLAKSVHLLGEKRFSGERAMGQQNCFFWRSCLLGVG